MIYRCNDAACGYLCEGTALPACCPQCGGALSEVPVSALNGHDWDALVNFLMEQ